MIDTININGVSKLIREYSTDENAISGQRIKINTRKGFDGNAGVVIADGDELVYPSRPLVPQTGTWQLKTTTPKKFIMVGTDDDNEGNAKVYRMLRTYGIPYKMNTIGSSVVADKNISNDIADGFTDADAPSLFPNYITPISELAKHIYNNRYGEIAMHHELPLWDSDMLTGSIWTEIYTKYVADGGTKNEEDCKEAIKVAARRSDIRQDAPLVAENREQLETLGLYIVSVGIWGGGYTYTLDDGITVNLVKLHNNDYAWREHNYKFASTFLNSGVGSNHNPWRVNRWSIALNMFDRIDSAEPMSVMEYYTHWWGDFTFEQWRTICQGLRDRADRGEIVLLTGEDYYNLGEFVTNAITSIEVNRKTAFVVGDENRVSDYQAIATYEDGTKADVSDEAIIDISAMDMSKPSWQPAKAYYRGFSCKNNIMVSNGENPFGECLFVSRNDSVRIKCDYLGKR